jgi:hypothetical protein
MANIAEFIGIGVSGVALLFAITALAADKWESGDVIIETISVKSLKVGLWEICYKVGLSSSCYDIKDASKSKYTSFLLFSNHLRGFYIQF